MAEATVGEQEFPAGSLGQYLQSALTQIDAGTNATRVVRLVSLPSMKRRDTCPDEYGGTDCALSGESSVFKAGRKGVSKTATFQITASAVINWRDSSDFQKWLEDSKSDDDYASLKPMNNGVHVPSTTVADVVKHALAQPTNLEKLRAPVRYNVPEDLDVGLEIEGYSVRLKRFEKLPIVPGGRGKSADGSGLNVGYSGMASLSKVQVKVIG